VEASGDFSIFDNKKCIVTSYQAAGITISKKLTVPSGSGRQKNYQKIYTDFWLELPEYLLSKK